MNKRSWGIWTGRSGGAGSVLTRVGAVTGALALVVALAGCGSDDDSDEDGSGGKRGTSAGSADQVRDDKSVERPEGFPEEVPVPSGEVHSFSEISDVGWRAMIVVPLDAEVEALKTEYTALYEDAGFTVTQEGTDYNMTAKNEDWEVDLVVRPPTITFQVLAKSG